MLYTQYKDAALKHLNACKTALHGLKFYHGNTPISQKKREALLHNIFYLSGYTLECIINYAIYRRVGFSLTSEVELLQDTVNNISFYKTPRGNTHKFTYFVQQHKFHKNIQLLHNLLPGGHSVPLVDRTINIAPEMERMIFDRFAGVRNNNHWRPELRYETTTPFSQSDIEELVKLTEQVYIQLLTVA